MSDISYLLHLLLDEVSSLALRDGVISADEETILSYLRKWFKYVEEQLTDVDRLMGQIDPVVKKERLVRIIKEILPEIVALAELDGEISEDEKVLIDYILNLS